MASFFRRAVAFGALLALAGGCEKPPETPPSAKASTTKPDDDHAHKESVRGGILVPVGGDKYHVEAVFEAGGVLRLFTLGADASTVVEVETQTLKGTVKMEGVPESEAMTFAPEPQSADKPGTTSQFVGRVPKALVGKRLVIAVPTVRIGAERYRFAFLSATSDKVDKGDHAMPAKVADEYERTLYLTPGGKYTAADIAANGGVTASQKFKGAKAEHDLKPKAGDPICPVTLTKASPKFTWVIDGKSYLFCCPPCVDEFVTLAKEKPAEIKPPEEYRQK